MWYLQLRLEAQPRLERRFLPGSACLLAGAQRGRRGCRLLVGFALAPQLRSPCLPACTDEHPPYGRLSPERGRCWLTSWEVPKEFREAQKVSLQTHGVGDGAQRGLISPHCVVPAGESYPVHHDPTVLRSWHCWGHPPQPTPALGKVSRGIPPWAVPTRAWALGRQALAVAAALLLKTWERSHTICRWVLQSKGQRCVGRREQLSADGFVVWCSASPQIIDAGSLPVKLERSLMRHVCCRGTLMYRERFLPGGKHFLFACLF